MTGKMIVLCTCSSEEEGKRIAREVVEKRLAACVNVVPSIHSIYRWEGAVEEAAECLLVMKTESGRYAELEQGIRAVHSYTTPEIIALPIERGFEGYLSWIATETAAR